MIIDNKETFKEETNALGRAMRGRPTIKFHGRMAIFNHPCKMGDHGTPYSKVSHRCKLLQEWMSDPGRSFERNHIMSSVVCPKGIQERIKKRVDKQIETAIGQMTQIIFGAQ